ncbi:MAG: deoxyribodipyrimidine photo-lyase [Pseudomonadota bacterium]
MSNSPSIVWFRNDVRIHDNPALAAACAEDGPIILVYILETNAARPKGAASNWWLHHSLEQLAAVVDRKGGRLLLRTGDAKSVLQELCAETKAKAVYWNRRYDAGEREIDATIKTSLKNAGVDAQSFNGSLLIEPWEAKTGSGVFYRVFSPFWKNLKKIGLSRDGVHDAPGSLNTGANDLYSDDLRDWRLLPSNPNWAAAFSETWRPGEAGANERLDHFLSGPVNDYGDGRNRPDCEFTSRLSPHLAFGEISPNEIWRRTHYAIDNGSIDPKAGDKFLSEIAWREFSYNLLYHYADISSKPIKPEFEAFEWDDNPSFLTAWQKGETGYPIVDAGMRQLWKTGWMHNRVRMIAASFLTKDLFVPWQDGEAWFWDTLVDADPANNSASWQWVAGCGADAAPYFRIFNPVTQGERYDPDGAYIREYIPALKNLPSKHIHAPWLAPEDVLSDAGITLGETYPEPIVDHKRMREIALERYQAIKDN